jgi:hypothetical protein
MFLTTLHKNHARMLYSCQAVPLSLRLMKFDESKVELELELEMYSL